MTQPAVPASSPSVALSPSHPASLPSEFPHLFPQPAIVEHAPLPLLIGSSSAREALHAQLGGTFAVHASTLVADTDIAAWLPRSTAARCRVAVAAHNLDDLLVALAVLPSTVRELHNIVVALVPPATTRSGDDADADADTDADVDAGVDVGADAAAVARLAAARLAALRQCAGCAVLAPSTASAAEDSGGGGRAREAFAAVLARWRRGEEAPADAFGAPAWLPGQDAVIAPGWDSEERVRAVVDAHGLSFADIERQLADAAAAAAAAAVAAASRGVGMPIAADADQDHDRDEDIAWMDGMQPWLRQLQAREEGARRKKAVPGPAVEDASIDDKRDDSRQDFFKRLLSGNR